MLTDLTNRLQELDGIFGMMPWMKDSLEPWFESVDGEYLHSLHEYVYTLYLFTASDFISVVYPETVFALFFCLSRQPINTPANNLSLTPILCRLPHTLVWIWSSLLVVCITNQRLPASIREDRLNKPWRPLPSGRLTPTRARQTLLLAIPVTIAVSVLLGGARETFILFTLNWIYNDLNAANSHYAARNLLNGLGITCFGAGAVSVMSCEPEIIRADDEYSWWLIIIVAVLSTTIQAQDLYDEEGDRQRGRSTVPLELGDARARWSVAIPVLVWSVAIPMYWQVESLWGCGVPFVLGCAVAGRVLALRSVEADRKTFKVWAVWMISLYALPWMKALGW
ncbi:MAG: hypothetical protein Q9227_008845 [Pyrenula ochraceoflavens]